MFQAFWPILVLLGIGVGVIVLLVNRQKRDALSQEDAIEPSVSNVKRLYFYAIAFASLMLIVNAGAEIFLTLLFEAILPIKVLVRGELATRISLGIAMIAVGTPLWLIHWRRAQHYLAQFPREKDSVIRKLYLYGTLVVGATLAFHSASDLLMSWFGGDVGAPNDFARLLVWSGVWAYHWRLEGMEGQPSEGGKTVRRLYLYFISAYTLGFFLSGLWHLLYPVIARIYDNVAQQTLTEARIPLWSDDFREGLAFLLVGGLFWGFHWLYAARDDKNSVLRQVYLYLYGILGGTATSITALAFILYLLLKFGLGKVSPAGVHFNDLRVIIPTLLVGMLLLAYHIRAAVQERHAARELSNNSAKAYLYLLSLAGVALLASSIIVFIPITIGLIISEARSLLAGQDWWRRPLAASITLFAVGLPLWMYPWAKAQREAVSSGPRGRSFIARRVFLYLVLAAAVMAVMGALTHLIFVIFRGILEGDIGASLLREIKWSMGVLVTALVFGSYYWQVLREDQALGVERVVVKGKLVTLLMGEGGDALAMELEEALSIKVRVLKSLEPGGSASFGKEEITRLVETLKQVPGDKVLVVVEDSHLRVHPYQ